MQFNRLNANLNPICHLLALLGAHHILHVSRVRVNMTVLRDLSFLRRVNETFARLRHYAAYIGS